MRRQAGDGRIWETKKVQLLSSRVSVYTEGTFWGGVGGGGQIKWHGMATRNSSGQSLLHVHVGLGPQPIVTGNY